MKRPTRVTRGSSLVHELRGASASALVGVHRAELVDLDQLVVEAVALLLEEHRPLAVELDGDRGQQHHRRQQRSARGAPTTLSNSHLITTSQSAIGLSKMSSTGTLPT